MDHQGQPQGLINLREALEVQLGLTLHASMHGADGDRQEVHAGRLPVVLCFGHGGVHHFPRVAFGVLPLHSRDIA